MFQIFMLYFRWVMLTVTWFLAAGLKWSNEAIEQRSPYFHAIAWIVPAIQTMIALLCFKVEGDVFGGVSSLMFAQHSENLRLLSLERITANIHTNSRTADKKIF